MPVMEGDTSQEAASADTPATTAASDERARPLASFRLPAFAPDEADLWLLQVECAFDVAGIADPVTKFKLLVANLPTNVAAQSARAALSLLPEATPLAELAEAADRFLEASRPTGAVSATLCQSSDYLPLSLQTLCSGPAAPMNLEPRRLLRSGCCAGEPSCWADLAMTSADRVPLVVGSSDSGDETSERGRRRRQRRLRRRRQRPAGAAPYSLSPSGATSADQPPTSLVQIQVRRCSRVGRPSLAASEGARSTPDLHVDLSDGGGSPTRGWTSPGGHLRAGTPPERGNRRLEGPHHSRSQSCRAPRKADYLTIPDHLGRCRSQSSLRDDAETGDTEYYRLRHFSVTGKGVVNCGDQLRSRRSRSNVSVASDCSEYSGSSRGPPSMPCSAGTSMASSANSSCLNLSRPRPYVGLMLGASGVGKTSLIHQFMTSDYMNAYDASLDEEYGEKSVSVLLDGEESELVFIDMPDGEMT
ncbi:uncharacterized protein LOC122363267, partial [Amphibalanus amphitrite]|uniref:uncharacterized protein LOC122363267 n=1 Tax=Amphibalanus amphitrite TaxID=1232801 RepID=UPI001C90F7B8